MKNKKIILVGLVFLLLIFILVIVLIFKNLPGKIEKAEEAASYSPPAHQSLQVNDPNIKNIKVEILSEEDRTEAGFGSRLADPADIQVISRDENGNITSYRKIYTPSDVVNSLYDPTGEKTAGMRVE